MKVLLTGAYDYSENQLSAINALGADIVFVKDEREIFTYDKENIEAVVCNGFFLYNDIKCFKNLKFIQTTSAGLDRVPLDYIKENNITLCNAGGVYSVPMAEYALLGTLMLYKQSVNFIENQKNKIWQKNRNILELTEKKVLIVGAGSVGRECAKRFTACGAIVSGVDLYPHEIDCFSNVYGIGELESQLSVSDIVILTLPLNSQTKKLFNKKRFSYMKPTTVLINISRGAIVDEASLIDYLENKKIGGAVLDVFENEPLSPDSKLWSMNNVIVTPHNSFISDKTKDRLFALVYKNLKAYMEIDDV